MFDQHASRHLAAYLDDRLDAGARHRVETHIAACPRCGAELEQVRQGMAFIEALPVAQAPEYLWTAIEPSLDHQETAREPAGLSWRFAAAAAAVAVLALAALWYAPRRGGEQWEVARLSGAPSIGSERVAETARIRGGQSIVTDGDSRARIQVGAIGTVDVEPNTHLDVLAAHPNEHRLALRSGEIAAKILAPPRLFFVETPAGTAVDLGCEYTLRCDTSGVGLLRVETGWVAFEFAGRESLVPAGANCRTRPGVGPGTPYFDDAPRALVKALEGFDFRGQGASALPLILGASRTRDTLTLWHLLSRVGPAERLRVYERMAALSPPPENISRERVLALDPESLTEWRQELAWTW
jgi:ferric-dicitrate binding protein FerR (iron transport regulator)